MPGQYFNFSQHDWPCLPLTTGLYSTTVSSITTTSAQGATKAIVDTAQEKVLPVPITKQEKAVHYEVAQKASDTPVITTEWEIFAPTRTTGESFTKKDDAVTMTAGSVW